MNTIDSEICLGVSEANEGIRINRSRGNRQRSIFILNDNVLVLLILGTESAMEMNNAGCRHSCQCSHKHLSVAIIAIRLVP